MTTSSLTRTLGYPKFVEGRAPTLLVMDSDYFLVRDVVSCAKSMGWKVECLPLDRTTQGESEWLKKLLFSLAGIQPDFLFTVNHFGFDEEGVLANILNDYGIPLASWFVDHPMPILGGARNSATSNTQLFCLERTALPWLRRMGFEDPQHLPTASNGEQFHPDKIDRSLAQRLGHPLTLVAGSWWQRSNIDIEDDTAEFAKQLAESCAIERNFLRDDLARLMDQNESDHTRTLCRAAQVVLAKTSLKDRVALVEALASLNPVVYGDQYWEQLVQGVQLPGPVNPTQELPAVFAGSDVNLNTTAAQMPTALNKRVWDVPGSGGFLLTDAQDELFEHFENAVEVATYHCPQEAAEKASYYLAHPAAREAVIEKGFARVEQGHRTHHRLQRMYDVMSKRFG